MQGEEPPRVDNRRREEHVAKGPVWPRAQDTAAWGQQQNSLPGLPDRVGKILV